MPKKRTDALAEKIPPQNLEAERALLGCTLIDEEARTRTLEVIRPEQFYEGIHQRIFSSILTLFDRGERVDLITVSNQLKKDGVLEDVGGVEYLARLVEMIPTAAHVEEYIRIVKDTCTLRNLIARATQIITEASQDPREVDAFLDRAESLIFEVSEDRSAKQAYSMKHLVHEAVEFVEQVHNRKSNVTGLPTGFSNLDNLTTGLQPSDLIVVASRPSMGKTAFACNIALNITSSLKDVGILIFSLEMSKEQLVQRMLCSDARVDLLKMRQGFLSDQDVGKLMQAAGRLAQNPIFIDDSPALNVFEVRARARRLKTRENIGLIIVDYLQLMRGRGRAENRQQEITEISSSLKALAKELRLPVIAISQLSRATEQREGKKPQLSDLRESGSIEQDADLVLLLYREEFYNPNEAAAKGKAQVSIAKQRNGPTQDLELAFLKEYTRFENLSRRAA